MTGFVLFLTVIYGNPHTVTQEFSTEQRCVEAKAALQKQYGSVWNVITCVPR